MKALSFSPSNQSWCPKPNPPQPKPKPLFSAPTLHFPKTGTDPQTRTTTTSLLCSAANPPSSPPLVVVGSANADIYVEIERLPLEGETVSAKTGQTLAGGKGANQAACGGRLSYPTYFVGQVGGDAHGNLIAEALESGGVCVDHLSVLGNVPTGHAVVMLQSDGQNSIIIVGGANMSCWPESLPDQDLELLRSAGIVLLQREIPDSVNIQVAKVRDFCLFFFFNTYFSPCFGS